MKSIIMFVAASLLVTTGRFTRPIVPSLPHDAALSISGQGALGDDGWVLPDPCGLSVVECAGEGGGKLPPALGVVRTVTAYTSRPEETDGSPCVSADGSNICDLYAAGERICATNAFPLGSVLVVDGLGTCTVRDRMARRFVGRVDWYMGMDTPRALRFGRQNLNVTQI